MDDGLDSSMDTGADDSEVTSYSADDIAELAAAAQEVLDAPPEDLPDEEAPAEAEVAPEPAVAPAAAPAEVAAEPAKPAATPVAAKGGCATLLVGICCVVALVALLLV